MYPLSTDVDLTYFVIKGHHKDTEMKTNKKL